MGYALLKETPLGSNTNISITDTTRYASFREQLHLVPNTLNQVECPFFLPPLATASITQVVPNQRTIVENTDMGVSLTINPGTAVNQDGSPYTGQLSISEVPLALAPAALPEFLAPPCYSPSNRLASATQPPCR